MRTQRVGLAMVWLLLAALIVGDLYVVLIGLPQARVVEELPGEPPARVQIIYQQYPPALLSLGALGVIAVGLARAAWRRLAWLGVGLHFAAGVLLIFGLGLFYLAATGALAVALSLLEWQANRQARWLLVSAGGIAVIVGDGMAFGWTPYGPAFLALGALSAAVVVIVVSTQRRATKA